MSVTRSMALALISVLVASSTPALETDQYSAWGREISDATNALNAKVNLEIERVLEHVNANGKGRQLGCHQMVKRILPRFRQFIFQDIELWTTNTTLVDRIPRTPEEELAFRQEYLYRITGPLDLGTKVPPSPTIEINRIRIGTDKLSHFFSEGWWYYKWYRKARDRGLEPEESEQYALRRGIFPEKTILGLLASGVFSLGDLEANFQGMRFLVELCEEDDPRLFKADGDWTMRKPFDIRDYVTPEWDESYHPSVFSKRRWKKVRPVLTEYCARYGLPEVVERRAHYARIDTVTPTERLIDELVGEGRLTDPRQFSIEANCTDP